MVLRPSQPHNLPTNQNTTSYLRYVYIYQRDNISPPGPGVTVSIPRGLHTFGQRPRADFNLVGRKTMTYIIKDELFEHQIQNHGSVTQRKDLVIHNTKGCVYDDGDCCNKTVNGGIVKTCHLSNQLVDNFCFYFIVLLASDLCQICTYVLLKRTSVFYLIACLRAKTLTLSSE